MAAGVADGVDVRDRDPRKVSRHHPRKIIIGSLSRIGRKKETQFALHIRGEEGHGNARHGCIRETRHNMIQ